MIIKDSVLYYPEVFDTTPDRIEGRINSNHFAKGENLDASLLRKVVNACKNTPHLPENFRYYLHL